MEVKDENQIRNLALLVSNPTKMLVHQNPAKSGKFNAFIEMETPEMAGELLRKIKQFHSDEFQAYWGNDKILKSSEQVDI